MNALKKAETAKQAGEGTTLDATVAATVDAGRNLTQELGLDPPGTRTAGVAQAVSVPLMPDASPALMPMELALEPDVITPVAPPATPSARDAPRASAAGGRIRNVPDAGRSGARAVFSAKQSPAVSSKAPFYGLIGLCLVAGAGYGFYLWMQMQPPARPPVVSAAPPAQNRPISSPTNETNQTSSASVAADVPLTAPRTSSDLQAPVSERGNDTGTASKSNTAPSAAGQYGNLAQRAAQAEPFVQRESSAPTARSSRLADAASAVGGSEVESPPNLRITRNSNLPAVNPDVLTGYAALQSGDLDRAGQAYDRALRSEPANRDALLGAATVLLRLDRTDAAEAYFRQLLRLHPHDTYATAQLAALTARGDPVGALSQVNSLIAREAGRPENGSGQGSLAFVQGNQLAAQGRWPEAQQAYFNAHRADPANADYCYNLAVSLDRMHEPRLARDFYRKALDMARGRAAGFDAARAQTRLGQIDGALK